MKFVLILQLEYLILLCEKYLGRSVVHFGLSALRSETISGYVDHFFGSQITSSNDIVEGLHHRRLFAIVFCQSI